MAGDVGQFTAHVMVAGGTLDILNRFLALLLIAAKKNHFVPLYRRHLTGDRFADRPGRPGDQERHGFRFRCYCLSYMILNPP